MEWQTIETCPGVDYKSYLFFIPDYCAEIYVGTIDSETRECELSDGETFEEGNENDHYPSHWMPLPEKPKAGQSCT